MHEPLNASESVGATSCEDEVEGKRAAAAELLLVVEEGSAAEARRAEDGADESESVMRKKDP